MELLNPAVDAEMREAAFHVRFAFAIEIGEQFTSGVAVSPMNEATVYVVDETADEHDGLRCLLALSEWHVEFFSSGEDFLEQFNSKRCACLLLEIRTRDLSATEIQSELIARGIALPTIIVARHVDICSAVDAMMLGAFDILQKPVQRTRLLERIREAIEVDRVRHLRLKVQSDIEARWARLTECERLVVRLIMEGKSNREIAVEMGCPRRTVESRRASIMSKMEAGSLAHLVHMVCTTRIAVDNQ